MPFPVRCVYSRIFEVEKVEVADVSGVATCSSKLLVVSPRFVLAVVAPAPAAVVFTKIRPRTPGFSIKAQPGTVCPTCFAVTQRAYSKSSPFLGSGLFLMCNTLSCASLIKYLAIGKSLSNASIV